MAAQYTVAVLSDIHGNVAGFDAALADLTTQRHDALVIAGDLVLNGPRPAESLARVREQRAPTIYGNTERFFVDPASPFADDPGVRWVRERIGADGLTYLASLPFEHRITPPGGRSPEDDLLIVHATPTDVDAVLVTELPQGATSLTITPEDEAVALIGGARAALILYGHIHCASAGTVRGQRVTSIGASGFPWDGDHRAAYALVAWDGDHWQVTHRRVAYAYDAVIAELARSDAPFAAMSIRRLREARWSPPS
ncbi:MAG: metallophosphoesterase family protein [Thermomicrobiales bacterium]